jgi:transcription elongation factor GreA
MAAGDVASGIGRATSTTRHLDVTAGTTQEIVVTAEGYEQLRTELQELRTAGRADMTQSLREARQDGPDNPLLYELLEAQAQLEQRIALLETQLASARVVRPNADGSAGVGSLVQVRYADSDEVAEYQLVGPIEPDVGSARVSVGAPVGRALLGARRGETVSVETPRGTVRLVIVSIRPETPSAPLTDPPARETAGARARS